jgi:hypothetical protein
MNLQEWAKHYNNYEIAEKLCYLQKITPYTDIEIIEAVDKVGRVGAKCGLSLLECVNLLVVNEDTNYVLK